MTVGACVNITVQYPWNADPIISATILSTPTHRRADVPARCPLSVLYRGYVHPHWEGVEDACLNATLHGRNTRSPALTLFPACEWWDLSDRTLGYSRSTCLHTAGCATRYDSALTCHHRLTHCSCVLLARTHDFFWMMGAGKQRGMLSRQITGEAHLVAQPVGHGGYLLDSLSHRRALPGLHGSVPCVHRASVAHAPRDDSDWPIAPIAPVPAHRCAGPSHIA